MVMAPPPTRDSAVSPCFHGCRAFLHRHFPPQSPPSHPLHLSAVSSSPRPGIAPQSLNSSSQPLRHLGYVWLQQGCLILIPFRLPQMSCFTLSLKCFSSDSDNCPDVGIGPLLQFPNSSRAGPVPLTLLLVPPGSFILPTDVVLYILFHWSGTPVCSQLVFCMHFCV